MEARLVWDTWRRILTTDALVDAVLEPSGDFGSLGLTPGETEVLADYAGTRAMTDQTIFMYRSGLVRNALCALRLVPLSTRLLQASGLDEDWARDLRSACETWVHYVRAGLAFQTAHRDRVLEVRSERLAAEPEAELASILEFLHVDPHPGPLRFLRSRRPATLEAGLGDEAARDVEAIAAETLRALGYSGPS